MHVPSAQIVLDLGASGSVRGRFLGKAPARILGVRSRRHYSWLFVPNAGNGSYWNLP